MSETINGGFILDDRETDPYGVVEMREKLKNKREEHKTTKRKARLERRNDWPHIENIV